MMTTNIDLITLGSESIVSWTAGQSMVVQFNLQSVIQATQSLLNSDSGHILFLQQGYSVNENELTNILLANQSVGVWYDAGAASFSGAPRVTQLLSPGIYFNLPVHTSGVSIWNISLGCLIVSKDVIRSLGFLNPSFTTVEGAMIDWIYRLLYGGALIERLPFMRVDHGKRQPPNVVPVEDEFRYIYYRLGKKWLLWSSFRYAFGGFSTVRDAWRAYHRVRKENRVQAPTPVSHSHWNKSALQKTSYKISIIIPTVERYPYLVTALNQLMLQTIVPFEVIVIDQTPLAERKPELFQGYDKIGLRYLTLEQSGQCGSRNLGLLQSSGDFILFIDDDVEVKPDLLEQHIRCMEYFNADVSCGVCDEVGAGPVPYDYSFIRHSDVFPTNNGLVRRSALEQSGLFDMAFDHGQRADGDIGARIYKTGARLILNPEIRVLHHRAPRGGLRKHHVRKVTYASSRKYITHFRLPHVTELYLNHRHFTLLEQQEYIILSLLGLFSIRGKKWQKILKVVYALVAIPFKFFEIRKREAKAVEMQKHFPDIPLLK